MSTHTLQPKAPHSARRNMALVAFVGFFYFFGFSQFALLPLFLQQQGKEPGEIGLMLSTLFFSAMLTRPLIGVIGSRVGYRRLGILAALLGLVFSPAYLLLNPGTLWLVYFLRVLQGISLAGIDLVVTMVPAELSSEERQARGFGLISAVFVVGWAISPAAAEWLLQRSSFAALFGVSELCNLLTLAGLLAMRMPERQPAPFRMNLIDGWSRTINRRLVVLLLISFVGLGLALTSYESFIPLYAQERGLGAGSAFFLFNCVTSALARTLLSGLSDRFGRRAVLIPSFMIGMLTPLLLYNLHASWQVIVTGLVYGLYTGLMMPALVAAVGDARQSGSDPALAIGLFYTAFDGGYWIGSSGFGFVSEAMGFGSAYLIVIGLNAVALVLTFFVPNHRRPALLENTPATA